jgi:hypothetical protein
MSNNRAATECHMGDEKRHTARRRVLKGGIVAFNDRHSTLPCAVRDVSDTGARLRVDSSAAAPDTFVLIIEIDGFEAECRVVWRKAQELGVSFVSPPRKVAPRRSQVVHALAPQRPPSLRRKP